MRMTINLLKPILTNKNGEAWVVIPWGSGLRVIRVRSYKDRILGDEPNGVFTFIFTFTPQSYALGFKITHRMLVDDAKKAETAIRAFAGRPQVRRLPVP